MSEKYIDQLKNISKTLQRINSKVKLVALLERAKREYDNNNYLDCEKACNEILKTNPKNPVALRGLGCVKQITGNYTKALEYYNLALEYSENKEIEYTLIGTIYYNQNNLDEAIKYYNLAIEVNDEYDLAYEGRNQSMLENHLKIIDLQDSLVQENIF